MLGRIVDAGCKMFACEVTGVRFRFNERQANDEGNMATARLPYQITVSLLRVLRSIQMFRFFDVHYGHQPN